VADTLWRVTLDTKGITGKNPFHYHLNYSRLKALRMQLKHSVPHPLTMEAFRDECCLLDQKRDHVLREIKESNPEILRFLNTIKVPLPEFDSSQ
jgi:hypothetical protein